MTVAAFYGCSNIGGFIKKRFKALGVQTSALAARSMGAMQQPTLAECIIFKYLCDIKQQTACCLK
jgi:hypothetical protein